MTLKHRKCVTQEWTHSLTCMQQSVLLSAIRGPDGVAKYHSVKYLIRWFRRCTLLQALDHVVLTDPYDIRGGSFTGPSFTTSEDVRLQSNYSWERRMRELVDLYLQSTDEMPHHFQLHFMHAVEILGYKHPDLRIRGWWYSLYIILVQDLHLQPETEGQLDYRLGDDEAAWRDTSSEATQA